jgi:Fur family peroxide stress response transcriptional regulator
MTYRLTPQRLAILGFLEGNEDHPSADDIYRKVKIGFPGMSRATVYNTLDLLCRRGEIAELTVDPERRRYDPDTRAHHHLICRACGRVVDIFRNFRVSLSDEERESFIVESTHVQFRGLCPQCREKEVNTMAIFKCEKCGATKDGRCRPKKCPSCGEEGSMEKQA